MLFQNVWMMLRWKYFRKPQRGPSVVDEDLFRFDNFRIKVWELAKNLYPYLTLSEGIKLAAIAFERDITKLSCCAR